jgi:hypothetical protein
MAIPASESSWGLFAVDPDAAETLTVVDGVRVVWALYNSVTKTV